VCTGTIVLAPWKRVAAFDFQEILGALARQSYERSDFAVYDDLSI